MVCIQTHLNGVPEPIIPISFSCLYYYSRMFTQIQTLFGNINNNFQMEACCLKWFAPIQFISIKSVAEG